MSEQQIEAIGAAAKAPGLGMRGLFSTSDLVAIASTGLIAATAITWNLFVGLTWKSSTALILSPAAVLFALSLAYRRYRPSEPRIAQLTLYSALWLTYPVFAVQLTYLGNALGFPQQDSLFLRLDGSLGFHWLEWAHFVVQHPLFLRLQSVVYESLDWQPFFAIIFLAFNGSNATNARFLLSILLGFAITTAIATFVPAIGPGALYHLPNKWDDVVHALRSGHASNLPYVGIVTFPSFHAMMAVYFTMIFAGNRFTLVPAASLNGLMLVSTCFCGQHYLVDILAGVCLAPLSYVGAAVLLKFVELRLSS